MASKSWKIRNSLLVSRDESKPQTAPSREQTEAKFTPASKTRFPTRRGLPEVRCDDTRRPGRIVDDRRAQQHLKVLLRPVARRVRSEPSHQMRRCKKFPRGAGAVLGDSSRCDQKLASLGVEDARHDRGVPGCVSLRRKLWQRV